MYRVAAPHPALRRHSRGSNLIILAVVAAMLIGFMGIAMYTGLQALVQGELQKAADTGAMAGAAALYTGGTTGKPTPNAGFATQVANATFTGMINSSGALKALGASGSASISGNEITVKAQVNMKTPFLTPVGVNQITIPAIAIAQALKYEPPGLPITVTPNPADLKTWSKTIDLEQPLVDEGPGTDLYITQNTATPFIAEACNKTLCYDLTGGVPAADLTTAPNGAKMFKGGSVAIDLSKAGVRKATKLRITMGFTVTVPANNGVPSTDPATGITTTTTVDPATGVSTTVVTDPATGTTTTTTSSPTAGTTTTTSTVPPGSPPGTAPTVTTSPTTPPPAPAPVTIADKIDIYGYGGACPISGDACVMPTGFKTPP